MYIKYIKNSKPSEITKDEIKTLADDIDELYSSFISIRTCSVSKSALSKYTSNDIIEAHQNDINALNSFEVSYDKVKIDKMIGLVFILN